MSDNDSPVLVEVAEDLAMVTLNRPKVLNAITPRMLEDLVLVLTDLGSRDDAKVIVITGAGRAFSAGVDLKALRDGGLRGGSVGNRLDTAAREVMRLLTTIPKVVIARVNGPCFTGAVELMMACDLAVAAEDATFGDTHAKWGLRPTWGMSARLWRNVGLLRARELSYTAKTFTGLDAADWGLVNRAVPRDELDTAVHELATAIADNSAGSVAAYKHLYRESLELGLSEGLSFEQSSTFEIADSESRIAGFD